MTAHEEEMQLRKRLLSILRQNNEHVQLYFDTYGYTPVEPMLAYLRTLKGCALVSRSDLWQVVENDPGKQIEWDGGALIRATYGFLPTISRGRLTETSPPEVLYYGTHRKLIRQGLEAGLLPIASEFVQLAHSPKDIGMPVDALSLLIVKAREAYADGIPFFGISDRYFMCGAIPPAYVMPYAD
ncbi:putative RNA 2'-phosphotransferase [Brevibacillus reuszeri]|uniref:RNA 2'-phosphotransferase n=1 Tax=Brevibacillus reuszeri TaxID=54915 RepID=A0A0K9YV23_9BACL|nr:RNA 2'-phosphotransferase [Brevibacillus reuszeri]KNB72569.1 RNA 2'-phosphotransferase [Brevibacillus reuszeri]MED1860748.1 RNA 2'-phosphotransferase [Brevibacillus reuszeri]GED70417.1 putative RNA 2'-phosphotransferase [Brevibacillus reuszeri]